MDNHSSPIKKALLSSGIGKDFFGAYDNDMSAEEQPWLEISRQTESVKVELGHIDGPNVWCNFEVLPTIQWMKTELAANTSNDCKKLNQEMLRLSRLQGGLNGTAEIIKLMRIIPGRRCSSFEDCYKIPATTEYRKMILLNLENRWIFTGQTDVQGE
jgi:hypothetical protein